MVPPCPAIFRFALALVETEVEGVLLMWAHVNVSKRGATIGFWRQAILPRAHSLAQGLVVPQEAGQACRTGTALRYAHLVGSLLKAGVELVPNVLMGKRVGQGESDSVASDFAFRGGGIRGCPNADNALLGRSRHHRKANPH